MSENFKLGEIVIAQYFDNFPEYNGCECEIINTLEFTGIIENDMTKRDGVLRYRVQFADGQILGPRPHQLRKNPKPDEKLAANDEYYFIEKLAA